MIIVISSATSVRNEHQIICQLFEAGMEFFQIYKPNLTHEQTENFKHQIPEVYHQKISLHDQCVKFHSLVELEACNLKYEYAFLSPVFDSISKVGYASKFDWQMLKASLTTKKDKIIALGGVDEDKLNMIRDLGFSGIALLGAIWQNETPVEKFKQIKERWQKTRLVY